MLLVCSLRSLSALFLLLCLTAAAANATAQTLTDPNLSVTVFVGSGLDQPTTLAWVGPNDMLVLEKSTGKVRRVLNGVLQSAPVLTVTVNSSNERGLLGIAVDHSDPQNVFLYYTEAATPEGTAIANRVYKYTWNKVTGTLVSPVLVLNLPVSAAASHQGGRLTLGPPGQFPGFGDGSALYAVIGDGERRGQLQNDPAAAPPDDTSVVLRVLQNGAAAPGNPFTPYCSVTTTQTCTVDANCPGGQTCRTQVARYWGYGVRNSFGLAIDPVTGSLWDTENGPDSFDEVNRVTAGSNSGWTDLMGPDAYDPDNTSGLFNMPGAGLTYSDPEFSWLSTVAPTGILFPVGSRLGAAYDNVALVVNDNFGDLYAFQLNAGRTAFSLPPALLDTVAESTAEANLVRLGSGFGAATDVELGPDGNVYVVDIVGRILRITGPRPQIPALPGVMDFVLVLALAAVVAIALRSARRV